MICITRNEYPSEFLTAGRHYGNGILHTRKDLDRWTDRRCYPVPQNDTLAIEGSDWHSHQEARRELFEYLEVWYNRKRRHSLLGYKSSAEYEAERALSQTTTA